MTTTANPPARHHGRLGPEAYWAPDRSVPILDVTIGHVLREAAADTPDALALIDGVADPRERRRWTYAELLAAAEDTAQALLTRFEPGECLAVWAGNTARWQVAHLGAALAGLVVVTINPAFTAPEARYVLAQSQAAGVIVGDRYRGADPRSAVDDMRGELPGLREVLGLEPSSVLWQPPSQSRPLPEVAPGAPAMMMFTSGTTGQPKGAVLTHRGLCNNAQLFGRRLGLPPRSVWLNAMPMFHLAGSSFGTIGSMWCRAAHVVTTFDSELMLDLIETERPAFLPSVPTMLIALMEHPSFEHRDLSSLQVVMAGATTLTPEFVRRTEKEFGCVFVPCFGQTEASGVIAQGFADDSPEDKAHRVGPPLEQLELKVVDPQTGAVVSGIEIGEFCLRGFTTMVEYFGMPEESCSALDAEGWLHTGDLGFMDERGYLQVTGRLKEMIIRGGENVYPREVEDVLAEHPDVAEVAVVGVPDERWGEQVAAVVRVTPGRESQPVEWVAFARRSLASGKLPRRWFTVDAMPLTASGKIQKFQLRDAIQAGSITEVTPAG